MANMSAEAWLTLAGLAVTIGVLLVQAVHYSLSLANAKQISDAKVMIEQLRTENERTSGQLKVYMHETFVTKLDAFARFQELNHKLERAATR